MKKMFLEMGCHAQKLGLEFKRPPSEILRKAFLASVDLFTLGVTVWYRVYTVFPRIDTENPKVTRIVEALRQLAARVLFPNVFYRINAHEFLEEIRSLIAEWDSTVFCL